MITLRGVSKTVSSGGQPLTILHPLDLHVKAGERLAIVGPSGSGKSTLIGLMAGLDQPSTGEILIDGTDITKLGEDALARLRGRAIGFVFQFFHLVPSLTAFENVLVPMEIAGRRGATERAKALLDEVGLSGRGHHYPSQLSGGEQQRVAVARALSNEPAVIMADEPTGNLDSSNGQHVIDLLFDVHARRGTTLVLVTHDVALAARADVQLSLRDGRVVTPAAAPIAGDRPGDRLGTMGFVVRMVGRELRGAWRRLIFFFVCIAIGVGAIAAIRSIIDQVTGVLTREARAMTGADIVVQSTRPWDAATTAIVQEEARRINARPAERGRRDGDHAARRPGVGRDPSRRAARRRSAVSALRHVHAGGRPPVSPRSRRRTGRAGAARPDRPARRCASAATSSSARRASRSAA